MKKALPLLAAAIMLTTGSCSRRAHPSGSGNPGTGKSNTGVLLKTSGITLRIPEVTINPTEKRRLEQFVEAGVESSVNTKGITPEEIIQTARGYLGVPHCMGGTTTKCMDCSGLLVRVFADHGITLPHSSEEQARYGAIITDRKNLKPGDLLFFIRTYSTSRLITHSGIYLGDASFIHTSSSRGVTVTSVNDPWWSERYLFATRILVDNR
ncbi:MAG: NlpC/P60 family protein [Bacteroidales bacterium]|jgi:cell wall-associated NlpC family hydrolase|nr:NlpC/P60 family protein [Bacteroidales bacterium]